MECSLFGALHRTLVLKARLGIFLFRSSFFFLGKETLRDEDMYGSDKERGFSMLLGFTVWCSHLVSPGVFQLGDY